MTLKSNSQLKVSKTSWDPENKQRWQTLSYIVSVFILQIHAKCASFFMGVSKLNAQRSGMPRRCVRTDCHLTLQISGTNPLIKAVSLPKHWTGWASAQLSTINNVAVTSTCPSSVVPHDYPLKNRSRAVRKLSKLTQRTLCLFIFVPFDVLEAYQCARISFFLGYFCFPFVKWLIHFSMYHRASREKVYKGSRNRIHIKFKFSKYLQIILINTNL